MTIALLTNLTYISTALAGLNEWTGDLVFLRRDIPQSWNGSLASLDTELPPDAHPLDRRPGRRVPPRSRRCLQHGLRPGDDRAPGQRQERSRVSAQRSRQRNLTHIYVDWKEIQRHRQPGGYGFTDFVHAARFAGWVAAGVLDRPLQIGPEPAALAACFARSAPIKSLPSQIDYSVWMTQFMRVS